MELSRVLSRSKGCLEVNLSQALHGLDHPKEPDEQRMSGSLIFPGFAWAEPL